MNKLRIWIIAVVMALTMGLTAAPANAQVSGSWPANNYYLDSLGGEAAAFWLARGVPTPWMTVYFLNFSGFEYTPPGNIIYINYNAFASIQNNWFDQVQNENLCYAMFHGMGHAGGLGHTAQGVMSQWGSPRYDSPGQSNGTIPFRCRQLANLRAAGQYP